MTLAYGTLMPPMVSMMPFCPELMPSTLPVV